MCVCVCVCVGGGVGGWLWVCLYLEILKTHKDGVQAKRGLIAHIYATCRLYYNHEWD